MTALNLVRFFNDLTNEFGPATRLTDLPLGVLEAERKRSEAKEGNGASPSSDAPGGRRAANPASAPGSEDPSR